MQPFGHLLNYYLNQRKSWPEADLSAYYKRAKGETIEKSIRLDL
jgi:hypothetical protein